MVEISAIRRPGVDRRSRRWKWRDIARKVNKKLLYLQSEMKSLRTYLVLVAVLLGTVSVSAQQRVRIAGLEDDPEYRRLTEQEALLSRASDSLSAGMNSIRRSLRSDTENRAANSAAILRMEEEMFDMRGRMAHLAGRINTIEQEWILRSLESGVADDAETGMPASPVQEYQFANLVYNAWFEQNLPPDELSELRQAQNSENEITTLTADYSRKIKALQELAEKYHSSATQARADSLKADFEALASGINALDARIAGQWSAIFDSKSYIYNYLMDKGNLVGLLEKYENEMEKLRQSQAHWQGVYASDAIVNYTLQKRLITDCEMWLAVETRNMMALDSLKKVWAALPNVEGLELPVVALRERLFLDYADIKAGAASPYNSRNPIPEVKIYPKGIIYRVRLGAFSTPQQPSLFRNVSPLAVQKGPDGKFRYFAGGFTTEQGVNDAVEHMRRHGFKAPQAVAWMDGVYINLTDGKGLGDGFYRVEISGVHELSPEIREIIRTVTEGKPIVRGADMFIVGPLDNALVAARLRAALENRDPGMEMKLSEIPNL
jgi:hypothetical protein